MQTRKESWSSIFTCIAENHNQVTMTGLVERGLGIMGSLHFTIDFWQNAVMLLDLWNQPQQVKQGFSDRYYHQYLTEIFHKKL